MIKKIISFSAICLIFSLFFSLTSCGDEDVQEEEQEVSYLTYNPAENIYATFGSFGKNKWEIVLDPSSGKYTKILETQSIFGGISSRVGANVLTSFSNNERLYIHNSSNSIVEIQSLETFETRQIELKDSNLDEQIIFPQILRFGVDENELYFLDTDKSLWKLNLTTEIVEKIKNKIPLSNDEYVSNIFQMPDPNYFVGMHNNSAINDYSSNSLFLYDLTLPDSIAIATIKSIESGFGFVQHPDKKNEIYYIQMANDLSGFRLMKLMIIEDIIYVSSVSTIDLPIDKLSFYLQTIHSASNSYILRGGSSVEGSISNTIYSIDLTTGSLKHEFEIEEEGYFLKLAGE